VRAREAHATNAPTPAAQRWLRPAAACEALRAHATLMMAPAVSMAGSGIVTRSAGGRQVAREIVVRDTCG
jgi:hypothetical protein